MKKITLDQKNLHLFAESVTPLLGEIYAIKWGKNSPVYQELSKSGSSVYSLCNPEPYLYLVVNKKEIVGAYGFHNGRFFDYMADHHHKKEMALAAKKFILDNKFEIQDHFAYKALGLIKEGHGFLDKFSVPKDYKRVVDNLDPDLTIGEAYNRYDPRDKRFKEVEDYHKKMMRMRSRHIFAGELENVIPKNVHVSYKNFPWKKGASYYRGGEETRSKCDFSQAKNIKIWYCDIRGADITFNPKADTIDLIGSVWLRGDLDFSHVKNLDLSYTEGRRVNIIFNPHAESISAVKTFRMLRGDLDFSHVKRLDLEYANIEDVTSIKFNPNAEMINLIATKINPNCKLSGLDNCTNPKLKYACERYKQIKAEQQNKQDKENVKKARSEWLNVHELREYCDLSEIAIFRRVVKVESDRGMAGRIKEEKTPGGNILLFLHNDSTTIRLFQDIINDKWLTPSKLRDFCNIKSHEKIEKYLAKMMNDKRMKGKIKAVYSIKAKREVLYLHDDTKSIQMFQKILSEYKTAEFKRAGKSTDALNEVEKHKIRKSTSIEYGD